MNFLEMYFRVKQQSVLVQLGIVILCLVACYQLHHWFSLIPLVTGMVYLIVATWAFELAVKDIEIDQTPTKERSPSQTRLQSFKIVLDWSMVILQTLIIILTAIAMVISQVSISG